MKKKYANRLVIGGKRFRRQTPLLKPKSVAKGFADDLRKGGYNARTVKQGGYYSVFARKKGR